jgi:type II secretory pathway pseudopilin PulG
MNTTQTTPLSQNGQSLGRKSSPSNTLNGRAALPRRPESGRSSSFALPSYEISKPTAHPAAFTIVELLAVIFTLAILAALALPLLAGPTVKDQQIQCLNNVKQLQIAWTCYANDNNGLLAQNLCGASPNWGNPQTGFEVQCQPGQPDASWVLGFANNVAPGLLTHGLIYPYMGNMSAYKCPADTSTTTTSNTVTLPAPVPTLRTYSLNVYMGGYWPTESGVTPTEFTKLATMALPPAMALTFVEENPLYINDGAWVQDIGALAVEPNGYWVDSPAHSHLNSGCLAFADGHCLMRKWTDKWVLANTPQFPPIDDSSGKGQFLADPTSPDNAWILPRCTIAQH